MMNPLIRFFSGAAARIVGNATARIFAMVALILVGSTVAGCGSSSSKNTVASSSGAVSSQASLNQSSLNQSSSLSNANSSAQAPSSPLTAIDNFYGLYVAAGRPGGNGLLGDAAKEQTFLTFVRDNGFNYIIFYDLFNEDLLLNRAEQVASLISRAKNDYGVKQVALALGGKSGADAAITYNQGRNASERIDVLNLEYEFWNEPNREQAFEQAIDALSYFRAVGQPDGLAVETYIGWINEQEGKALARELDRVLVHYYRTSDVDLVNYGVERLEYLASGRTAEDVPLVISPIFSNEGPLNTNDVPFMGAWLKTNPHEKAYRSWQTGYQALSQSWKNKLLIEGATWFIYDKFLDVRNLQSHITAHPENQRACAGDTLTLSVASSVNQARYCWMFNGACLQNSDSVNGADTAALKLSSLTAENEGEYYARVISDDSSNPQSFASRAARVDLNNCLP